MPLDVSFACPDWEEKLRRGETPIPSLPLNEKKAARAVMLFNSLRLPDVPGQPTLAEAGGEWFRDMIRAAFAAEHPETGLRLVNEVFCLVPKKNSKTTNAAALGLTALMLEDRPNAAMMILGPTQEVAERCFNQAWGMIKADDRLRKVFHVQDHLKTITRIKTGATLKVKTFDMSVVTGDIPALTIIDEEHVIAAKRFAKRVMSQIRGGMITNPNALLVIITTQSDVEPMGVFKEDLERARKIRDGVITAGVRTLAVLYEFPEAMQLDEDRPWMDPTIWAMVLPNLGLSVQMDLLYDLFLAEREKGPAALSIWASQHLNIQVGLGTHDGRWIGADYWDAVGDDALDLPLLIETSDVAVIGVDMGGADDLAAVTVIGRHRDSRKWQVWSQAWGLPVVLERRQSVASKLDDIAAEGGLIITETAQAHVTGIADVCDDLRSARLLPKAYAIGLDPWGVGALHDELLQRGFEDEQIARVGQGYKLNGAIKGLERRLLDGNLVHGGQMLMRWCMANTRATTRGNNVYITKEDAGSAKIDPVVAMFNAAMLMDMNPIASGVSVYEQRGALVI